MCLSAFLTTLFPEFPVINPSYVGRPCRYVYYATLCRDSKHVLFDGVIKVDVMDGKEVGLISYGGQRYGGECVFVPKENAVSEQIAVLILSLSIFGESDCFSFFSVFFPPLSPLSPHSLSPLQL